MRRRIGVALVGASLIGLLAADHAASAQSVPMPVPAPHSRMRPPPAATAEKPKPPAAPKHVAQVGSAQAAPATSAGLPLPKPVITARATGSASFDDKQRALIERANAYLTGVSTLIGNFVQVGPDGSRSEGKFYLQKPGRVRFEYNPPSPTELIADGSSVAIRDRRLNTQDVWPLSQTPLRFLVADRVDLLKDTVVVGASSDDTFATIVIEERQALGGTHRVMLMFGARDFQLRQWTITDPQGYDTTVALYNLDARQKPDPSLFKIDYTRYLQ
jgi:outer membrane lipoprotein-sorting protein